MVKVWEERPLSLYTYAQLFLGGNFLGARILVHRDELFERGKPGPPIIEEESSPKYVQRPKLAKNLRLRPASTSSKQRSG